MGRVLAFLFPALAFAGEGKWTPQQVLELGPAWVKSQGFSLPLEGCGTRRRPGGCSSTRSPCPAARAPSSRRRGSSSPTTTASSPSSRSTHARAQPDSRPATSPRSRERGAARRGRSAFRCRALHGRDEGGARRGARGRRMISSGSAPSSASRRSSSPSARRSPATRCQVATFDGGDAYTLAESLELTDVRLVYAPPRARRRATAARSDNWMWPRHTGDFALVRAYARRATPTRRSTSSPSPPRA